MIKYKIFIDNLSWLLHEWHPIKNLPHTPSTISANSHKKIWWQCKEFKHEWLAACKDRTNRKSGCPVCSGRKPHISNCLETTHPDLTREWHPIKNGLYLPNEITAGSNKKVWWQCLKDQTHEWQAACANRAKKQSGCPFCSGRIASFTNSLATLNKSLAAEWHPTKNAPLLPRDVTLGSTYKIWWLCSKDQSHEWRTTCNNRTSKNGTGCPLCANATRITKKKLL